MTKSSEGHKTDLCVHEGHDASIDPQVYDDTDLYVLF